MNKPDFGRDRFEGQMNPSERELLYNLVLQEKPDVVCEVGTCRGGGSTYFIAKALQANGKGKLYTCENNKEYYEYARALYAGNPDFAGLEEYVRFHFGDSEYCFHRIFEGGFDGGIDIVFLDGGADSIKMVYDFAMFRPFIPVGKWLIMHDWDNGKTDYIKPILMNEHDWKLIKIELGTAIFQRIADVNGGNS
jgi:predicted O-methyltransferase YrrM